MDYRVMLNLRILILRRGIRSSSYLQIKHNLLKCQLLFTKGQKHPTYCLTCFQQFILPYTVPFWSKTSRLLES